jgi:hypothetical protein
MSFNEKNRPQFEKPPIGRLRDLNKEEAQKLLELEFISIEGLPELKLLVKGVLEEINQLRASLGLSPVICTENNIRLLPVGAYEEAKKIKGNVVKEEGGAFYDPNTGSMFLKFEKEKYDSPDSSEKFTVAYKIAHELVHKSMSGAGLAEYSAVLNEGLTELLGRDAFEKVFKDKFTSSNVFKDRNEYAEGKQVEVEGFKVTPEDIIFTYSDEGQIGAVGYPYIAERNLVKAIRHHWPKVYSDLLEAAFLGDFKSAEKIIDEAFGESVKERFKEKEFDIQSLLNQIVK